MAPLDRPKRMLVRTTIVAGSTVATLIGAQTLITVDSQNPALNNNSTNAFESQIQSTTTAIPQLAQPTATVVVRALPTIQIAHVAPSITIVRESGQVNDQSAAIAAQPTIAATQVIIQPPAPVQVATNAPIVVQQSQASVAQQAAPPRTHSSR